MVSGICVWCRESLHGERTLLCEQASLHLYIARQQPDLASARDRRKRHESGVGGIVVRGNPGVVLDARLLRPHASDDGAPVGSADGGHLVPRYHRRRTLRVELGNVREEGGGVIHIETTLKREKGDSDARKVQLRSKICGSPSPSHPITSAYLAVPKPLGLARRGEQHPTDSRSDNTAKRKTRILVNRLTDRSNQNYPAHFMQLASDSSPSPMYA